MAYNRAQQTITYGPNLGYQLAYSFIGIQSHPFIYTMAMAVFMLQYQLITLDRDHMGLKA